MRKSALFQTLFGRSLKWGLFKGMTYIGASIHSVLGPKILGTYEKEIAPVFEQACSRQHRLIVDVGAAEGYYAVGLALRNPSSRVVAFEADPGGRKLLEQMIEMNAVGKRVRTEGYCSPGALEEVLSSEDRALVVMDVEGGEQVLLDPAVCPSLLCAEIVVELHEFIVQGIGDLLVRRFTASHHVREILEQDRTLNDLPPALRWLALLVPKTFLLATLKEHRPARMSWLHMVPKAPEKGAPPHSFTHSHVKSLP
jgi:hypothetical protein